MLTKEPEMLQPDAICEGENTLRNVEYGMRNLNTYTLRNYRYGMFGYLLAVGTIAL